jgi:uncharacterized membrane protein
MLLLLVAVSGCAPLQVQVQNAPSSSTSAANHASAGGSGAETPPAKVPGAEATESTLTIIVTYLAFVAEICGALVIGVAVVRGLLRYIPHIFGREPPDETYTEGIRLQLGKSLALALEFELGADILRTAVAPTLSIILQTAAIAALRTFLNYFLDRELRESEQRRARQAQELDADAEGARVYATKPDPTTRSRSR